MQMHFKYKYRLPGVINGTAGVGFLWKAHPLVKLAAQGSYDLEKSTKNPIKALGFEYGVDFQPTTGFRLGAKFNKDRMFDFYLAKKSWAGAGLPFS